MCEHFYLLCTLHVSAPVLGHHQAHDEYNCVLISIWIHIMFLLVLEQTFGINSHSLTYSLTHSWS
jgi:hypothetical protein